MPWEGPAGAVAGWAMSATFATITAAVEDLPAFEISDMKKLPLEESNEALLRQLGTLFLSFREQRYVQNCHMAEFIPYQLLDPSV